RPTNASLSPPNLLTTWGTFKYKNPTVTYLITIARRASVCLAEACTKITTSYIKAIVEGFEAKLSRYIKNMVINMKPELVNDIAVKYCYQFICQEEPSWPNDETLTENMKKRFTGFYLPLKDKLNSKVTLSSLSQSPENLV
ncbi:MAG: hypothetical protein EXX96DRAFT_450668, partial [Benjaminiella poitrasii]